MGILNKSAADKDAKINADLQAKVQTAAATTPGAADAAKTDKQQAFDIAKFAGIFAALGMAIGYIGSAFTKIIAGIQKTPLRDQILILLGLMIVISGPSCFIAWTKLRKRNLGPILNANGGLSTPRYWSTFSSAASLRQLPSIRSSNLLTHMTRRLQPGRYGCRPFSSSWP